MNASTKILKAAAGTAAAGGALTVDQVFSIDLYTGNGSAQTITNGLDMSGEGGLVWGKTRNRSSGDFYSRHFLYDTERGTGSSAYLHSDGYDAQGSLGTVPPGIVFNTDGFTTPGPLNNNNEAAVAFSFRKAPKFFDIVQFTGDGTSNRSISHNITNAGLIVVKQTNTVGNWFVWHRHFSSLSSGSGYVQFNSQYQAINTSGVIDNITSTSFDVHAGATNGSGQSFIAYIFADNSSDSSIDAADKMIACSSYNGSSSAQEINVGFEPQFILQKRIDDASPWRMHDIMRGMPVGSDDAYLSADSSAAEADYNVFSPTPTGFRIDYSSTYYNTSGGKYIYMAIRRDDMSEVTDATKAFAVAARTGASGNLGAYRSGFVTDMAFHKVTTNSSNPFEIGSRLVQGKSMNTTDTNGEVTQSDQRYDFMDGWNNETSSSSTKYAWMWKRAKSYFDCVAYTGAGSGTVQHGLTVPPEMMWVKVRSQGGNWFVYHKDLAIGDYLELNTTAAKSTYNMWNNTAPTATHFSVGALTGQTGYHFISYHFATLAGVSKVSSVVHSGTTNVDAGFSNGSRFVLLKRIDAAGDWYIWDSLRSIVSGDDPYLLLNSTAAEVTNTDYIDPYSAGFTITSSFPAGTYIYYAIA